MHENSKPITEYHISDTQERMPVPAAKTNHSRTSGNNTTADVLGTKKDEDASEHNEEMEAPEVFFHVTAKDLAASPDPRAKRELAMYEAARLIRDYPIVPADPADAKKPWAAALAEDMAVPLPSVHCSFKGCCWTGQKQEARDTHILKDHKETLKPLADTLPLCFSEDTRLTSVYNQLIALKVRSGAPISSFAIERRAVDSYMRAIECSAIEAPMCFICACKFPYVSSRTKNEINWRKPFMQVSEKDSRIKTFMTWQYDEVQYMFGLDEYLENYGEIQQNKVHLGDAKHLHEFEDWVLTVPFAERNSANTVDLEIICCPEDRRCSRKRCGARGNTVCAECEIPICQECENSLEKTSDWVYREPPARALSNELMIFYGPKSMYEDKMIVMEMICSSVCITSMICFSMEVKYGNLLDTTVHKQDMRVAARGNATSFLMPWQSILAELGRQEKKSRTRRQSH